MAADCNISIDAAKAAVDAVVAKLHAGTAGNVTVKVMSGAQPASPDVAATGTPTLATIALGT